MYKLHLILKYLRKRRIAWVSLAAVMLCTAMVLVVLSVMAGWLRMWKQSFHGLSGDIIVQGQSLVGFPYYGEMVKEIQDLPEVAAAVPIIHVLGLINIANQKPDGVQVYGIPIDRIGRVNQFPQSLWRQYNEYLEKADDPKLTPDQRKALREKADEGLKHPSFALPLDPEVYRSQLPKARMDVSKWPGMIAGSGVLNIQKNKKGEIEGRGPFLYRLPVKLTVLGISPEGFSVDLSSKAERNYWIADISHTKFWQYDSNSVYVSLDILQRDLGMDEQQRPGEDGQETHVPARVTDIHVKVKAGYALPAVRDKVQAVVDRVLRREQHGFMSFPPKAQTWEETQSVYMNAIGNEVVLTTFLFSLISIVAVFLIFCIFYMIVVEKTRDIGIIKSVGASSGGVASIFLGYGLAIGIVGSLLGLGLGWGIVHNINFLHAELGKRMGIVLWDPRVYAFDTIPNTMDPKQVMVILAVAVAASVVGALIPAVRAARLNPIESMRWE